MAYCTGKSKAILQYYFSDKKIKTFESALVPIGIETVQPDSLGVCWRFFGQGVNNDAFFELFACGESPSFEFNGLGFDLYMDGVRLGGSEYYYRSGTNSVSRVDQMVPTPGLVTSGNCDCLAQCEIKVIKDNKIIFSDKGDCPLKFTVTCDDDCPENSHKCKHNKYPGYCCIPCKQTGDRLKNIANKVGR